jgi:hypothetical protein
VPAPAFVASLEDRLFRSPRPARTWSWRPALLGASAAVTMAAVALVLALAGVGPLATGDDQSVKAKDDCRYVTVQRTERVPTIVTGSDGQPELRFQERQVERRVKRCR